MEEEPSDELMGLERHGLLLIPIGIVSPAEGDLAVVKHEDTVIADHYPLVYLTRHWRHQRGLAIDDPFFVVKVF